MTSRPDARDSAVPSPLQPPVLFPFKPLSHFLWLLQAPPSPPPGSSPSRADWRPRSGVLGSAPFPRSGKPRAAFQSEGRRRLASATVRLLPLTDGPGSRRQRLPMAAKVAQAGSMDPLVGSIDQGTSSTRFLVSATCGGEARAPGGGKRAAGGERCQLSGSDRTAEEGLRGVLGGSVEGRSRPGRTRSPRWRRSRQRGLNEAGQVPGRASSCPEHCRTETAPGLFWESEWREAILSPRISPEIQGAGFCIGGTVSSPAVMFVSFSQLSAACVQISHTPHHPFSLRLRVCLELLVLTEQSTPRSVGRGARRSSNGKQLD